MLVFTSTPNSKGRTYCILYCQQSWCTYSLNVAHSVNFSAHSVNSHLKGHFPHLYHKTSLFRAINVQRQFPTKTAERCIGTSMSAVALSTVGLTVRWGTLIEGE